MTFNKTVWEAEKSLERLVHDSVSGALAEKSVYVERESFYWSNQNGSKREGRVSGAQL